MSLKSIVFISRRRHHTDKPPTVDWYPIDPISADTFDAQNKNYRPISASVATVAMRELEYNLQLFWQFQQEMIAKVSAAEPSRKSSRVIFI